MLYQLSYTGTLWKARIVPETSGTRTQKAGAKRY
jgi:hypothetical protein